MDDTKSQVTRFHWIMFGFGLVIGGLIIGIAWASYSRWGS